ncbi:LPS export ABC transporter permease LptF [Geomonas sp. Red32]|uniref:LPS export ABC transporter permease LptF n=1 Tax=Geomonas sp. Red32 TaxID=2912856 RepID=UPI00202CF95D|nr:LPS export ABC transporter permease LptF [Geomonas sp. Red32]MCM0084086.1 LPS export ABC transporter permease LptF [Geomonas sp. Red32]
MKRTLYGYIFKEIPPPFLVGMATFTFVLLMGRFLKLAEMVVEKGVPVREVALMIGYLLPSFWLYTVPMALLMAILLAFGRLSGDSEVTAMKSCGISLYGMLPPALSFAALAWAACLTIAVFGVPWGNNSFKQLLVEIARNSAGVVIKEKIFNDAFPGLVIYADSFDQHQKTIGGVIIHDERDPANPSTIFAAGGALISDRKANAVEFHLRDGSIHRLADKGSYRLAGFSEYDLRVSLPAGPEATKGESEMNLEELLNPPPKTSAKDRLSMRLEYHNRLALPFSCFVFALIALPLGIQNRRSGKAAGFSVSIGVILLYYIMLSGAKTLGERGIFSPALASWSPNAIFLLLGIYLLRKAAAEEPLPLTVEFRRLRLALVERLGRKGRG